MVYYLGCFHCLKSQVNTLKEKALNVTQLIENVKQSYANYNSQSFSNIWCQLFACYNEILSTNGGNK